MKNVQDLELTDKIRDLCIKIEKAEQLKGYICTRLLKNQCPGCPLIQICDILDKLYTKTVFIA